MNRSIGLLAAIGIITALIMGCASSTGVRIGVYDSRAIAIAHGNSNEGREFIMSLMSEMSKAKADKNDSLMQHIEKKAKMYQVLSHLRAFSVGSVADILEKHKAEVDQVAKEAGVQVVVSKFELIYTGSGVEIIDVTIPLARIFKPSDQAMQTISGIQEHEVMLMLDVLMIPPEE
ncbi:MAG: hypothetical protein WBE28_11890 [bacterium]